VFRMHVLDGYRALLDASVIVIHANLNNNFTLYETVNHDRAISIMMPKPLPVLTLDLVNYAIKAQI